MKNYILIPSLVLAVNLDKTDLWLESGKKTLKSMKTVPGFRDEKKIAKNSFRNVLVNVDDPKGAKVAKLAIEAELRAKAQAEATSESTEKTTQVGEATNMDGSTYLPEEVIYKTNSPGTDGTADSYNWQVGEFTQCSKFCGTGTKQRSVKCVVSIDGENALDKYCELDYPIKGKGFPKPHSVVDCEGECTNCPDVAGNLFMRARLGEPAEPAISTFDGADYEELKLCPKIPISCCTAHTEQVIKSQASLATRALDSILLSSPSIKKQIAAALESYNKLIDLKLIETSSALSVISTVTVDSLGVLPALTEVLHQRSSDLVRTLEIMKDSMALVNSQVDDYKAQLQGDHNDQFSMCGEAAISLNSELSCASCSPDFSENFVNKETNMVYVSMNDCYTLFDACEPIIVRAHGHLKLALDKMKEVHVLMKSAASRLQPALKKVWNTLQFDWVPDSVQPSDMNTNPDLTQLQCLVTDKMFALPDISNQSDFCAMYFSPFAPTTFASRLERTLMHGVKALNDVSACDGCIHGVLVRLSSMIASGSAQLDVQLQLASESAIGGNPCVQAARIPESVQLVQLMTKSLSFSQINHRFDANQSNTSHPVTTNPVNIGFVLEGGVEAATAGNFSSFQDLMSETDILAPEGSWKIRDENPSALSVWDYPCDEHSDCNKAIDNANGDAPWWFCASKSACDFSTCTGADEKLLSLGSRCAQGPCLNSEQGVDGACPDEAICPVTSFEKAGGATYFAKFQSYDAEDPASVGVCDCAFSGSEVIDECIHGLCSAYALIYEDSSKCRLTLTDICLDAKKNGCNIDCDVAAAKFNPPSCGSYQVASLQLEGSAVTGVRASAPAMGLNFLFSAISLIVLIL